MLQVSGTFLLTGGILVVASRVLKCLHERCEVSFPLVRKSWPTSSSTAHWSSSWTRRRSRLEYKTKLLSIRINTTMLDETRAQIRSMLITGWGFDPPIPPEGPRSAEATTPPSSMPGRPQSQGSRRSGRKRQLLGHPTCPAQSLRGSAGTAQSLQEQPLRVEG